MEFYSLFFDDEIVQLMVLETNRYAAQRKDFTPHSRMNKWYDTNPAEMGQFCGLVMWMGLVRMPSVQSYWQHSCLYRNDVAAKTMTRN